MKKILARIVIAFALVLLAACSGGSTPSGTTAGGGKQGSKIKIGFIVKQPEVEWFRLEWQFAQEAADKYGFELVKLEGKDGDKVLAQIDTLAAQGAKGFVICTPDVRLGPAIVQKAKQNNLKVIAVDDQFLDATGKPMTNVPYLGISARSIGNLAGSTLIEEMLRRKWDPDETFLCAITYDELETTKDRTGGAIDAVRGAGFLRDHIYFAPTREMDLPNCIDAANAMLAQHSDVKKWLVCGGNDYCVLGAVRAMEGKNISAENIIGVGINGTECIPELKKEKPTGFYASVLLSAKEHGFRTAEMLYKWIAEGVVPPADTRTAGVVITRENFRQVRAEQGIKD